MFGNLFKKVAHSGKRLFGSVGDTIRQWGNTAQGVARTIEGHRPALKSFVSSLGSHFGDTGNLVSNIVNKGLDVAPNIIGRIGEKMSQFGTAVHPDG